MLCSNFEIILFCSKIIPGPLPLSIKMVGALVNLYHDRIFLLLFEHKNLCVFWREKRWHSSYQWTPIPYSSFNGTRAAYSGLVIDFFFHVVSVFCVCCLFAVSVFFVSSAFLEFSSSMHFIFAANEFNFTYYVMYHSAWKDIHYISKLNQTETTNISNNI